MLIASYLTTLVTIATLAAIRSARLPATLLWWVAIYGFCTFVPALLVRRTRRLSLGTELARLLLNTMLIGVTLSLSHRKGS